MGEAFIVRRGGVVSDTTAAPTITIISEANRLIFTLTNNDDNTAFITYEIDDVLEVIELAAAATSDNITIALDPDTYTLTAYATVVDEVATKSDEVVEIVVVPEFDLLYDSLTADNGNNAVPATQLDITGLSIGKNDELRLVYTMNGDSTGAVANYTIRVNDITSNYHVQMYLTFGTGNTVSRNTDSIFDQGLSGQPSLGYMDIKVSNNDRFVAQIHSLRRKDSILHRNGNLINTDTVTSITKLSIISSRTNGIAASSRIRLYKINGEDA